MNQGTRRSRNDDGGFTLIEVVVAMTVLVVILAPLAMALASLLRNTAGLNQNLGQSNDAQRISSYWTRDTANLDPNGPDVGGVSGQCQAATTVPNQNGDTALITFNWDNNPAGNGDGNPTGNGQPKRVPKTATWWITGSNEKAQLVRRYCEAGVPQYETVIANHWGKRGTPPALLVHGADATRPQQFCTTVDCTITVAGAYSYKISAARRIPGNAEVAPAVPPPPTITGASPRNNGLSVAWTGPTVAGSSDPLTGFIVKVFTTNDASGAPVATQTLGNDANAADVNGLANGTSYYVVVYATSAVGTSPPSNIWGPVTPNPTTPLAPLTFVADPGGLGASPATLALSWVAPTDNGGSAIDKYTVRGTNNATGLPIPDFVIAAPATTATLPNLASGTSYTLTISAHNALGDSAASLPATGITRPPKPVITGVTAQDGKATVTMSVGAPDANGDVGLAPSQAARVTATCTTNASGCTNRVYLLDHPTPTDINKSIVLDTGADPSGTPLINGQPYTFTVDLKNVNGYWGAPSNGFTVAPTSTPSAPTDVTIAPTGVSQTLLFQINTPFSQGSAVSSYVITPVAAPSKAVTVPTGGNTTTFTWDGTSVPAVPLTDFTLTSFTVKACNSVGCGADSAQFGAMPGVAPVPTGITANQTPGVGSSANVTVTSQAGTTANNSTTTWAVTCPGPVTGTITGGNGTTSLAGVASGTSSCSAVVTNYLTATVSGTASNVPFTADPVSAPVDVYGAPGAMGAPILALPASPDPTTSVIVTMSPWPVTSGGADPTNTYLVKCTAPTAFDSGWIQVPSGASATVPNVPSGVTATCQSWAQNSRGVDSKSPFSTIFMGRTVPTAPSNVTIVPTGVSKQLAFTINAPYDGGNPITSYEISQGANKVTISPTGAVTTYTWDGTSASTPLTDYASTPFTIKACNTISGNGQTGCSSASATFNAMSGVAPGGTISLVKSPATPKGLDLTATGTPGTGAAAVTSWAVDCGGGHTGTITGLTGTVTITNNPIGLATCSATPTNKLTSTTNGAAGTTNFVGATQSQQSQVYDTPGVQTAPTLTLPPPASPDVTTTIFVQANPYPLPSGGTDTTVTYAARCTATGYDSNVVVGPGAPVKVTGAPANKVISCVSIVENSAGYRSTSPAATITTARVQPSAPTDVTIVPTGGQKEVQFTIVGGYDGGLPITGYEIYPNGDQTRKVAFASSGGTGVATSFTYNPTTAPALQLSNFNATGFQVAACNSVGCTTSAQGLINFSAAPAPQPVVQSATAARGGSPKTATVSITGKALTGNNSTTWAITCAGGATGSASTLTPAAVTVNNVAPGTNPCTVVGKNTVTSTNHGTVGTSDVLGASFTTNDADVYDVPGAQTAPTLSLPGTGALNHVLVQPNPYPVSSGGAAPDITYQARCNAQVVNGPPIPIDVPGFTPGETVVCVVVAYNSAGFTSTSPSATITLTR